MVIVEILEGGAAAFSQDAPVGDMLFDLGMICSAGRDAPVDLVSAHKWFNLAAARGNREAARLRREIANQMTDGEIAAAQRAARDWLRLNEQEPPAVPSAIAA
ncbi:MAG: hypothetical protein WBF58_22375 [Xanthobacteraceae bacterium]